MNTLGHTLKLTLFGKSHSETLGCILAGLPPGVFVDLDAIKEDLVLRKPTFGIGTTRIEADVPEIKNLSKGKTTGEDVIISFENQNVESLVYETFKTCPRPGHADYPALIKYGESHDIRGGGIFSGRMTLPLVAAGALLRSFVKEAGVEVGSYVTRIGKISDENAYEPSDILKLSRTNPLRAMNSRTAELMQKEILSAKTDGDSVGGVVRCVATKVPIGVGEPFFDTLDGEVSKAIFSIPGVKGISFGAGFLAAEKRGSENNDWYFSNGKNIFSKTNSAGGVLGGMANGSPLDFTVAFKPTPSIQRQQQTVNIKTLAETKLSIAGRHDPCIVPRAAIAVEAMTVFTIADLLMRGGYLGRD